MANKLSTAICYTIAIALASCLAALSAGHWFIQLEGQPNWVIAVAVLGSVCVSLLVAVCAFLAGRGFSKVLLGAAFVFLIADTYQNGLGYQTVTSLTVSGEVEAAQSRLSNAQIALQGIVLPERTCLCPKTKAADLAQYEAKRVTPLAEIAKAEAALEKLNTPKASDVAVMAVMLALQIANALLFSALGRGSQSKPVEAAQELNETDNVVVLRPKRMSEKDMQTWAKIARV